MSRSAATLRDSAGVAFSQYLARAMVLGRGLLAASVLGPQGFGGWNALNLILDYGFFAPAGALQGLDLELPGNVARADAAAARRQMAGALSATLAGALLFSVLVLVLPGAGARELTDAFGAGAVPLMLAAALLQLGVLYFSSALRAYGRFGAVSRALSLQALVGGGLGIALLWSWGVWGLIFGWIAGSVLAAVVMRAAVPEAPILPGAPRAGLALARAGLPIFAFYALSLVLRSTDRIAFVHFGQAEALGHYSLGLMGAGLVLYAPEALGFVLFPRMAAAAEGASDPAQSREEMLRAQRGLAAVLPVPVALGMIWAEPIVGSLLPAYREGLPALRLLAFAATLVAVGTLPGYFLLATRRNRRLLTVGSVAVAINAVLVFATAARDPRPAAVASAVVAGYACFAVGLVVAASFELFDRASARIRYALGSFAPPLLIGAAGLFVTTRWPAANVVPALVSTLALLAIALPVMFVAVRGAGLRFPGAARAAGSGD